jgi:hypothetical protein
MLDVGYEVHHGNNTVLLRSWGPGHLVEYRVRRGKAGMTAPEEVSSILRNFLE